MAVTAAHFQLQYLDGFLSLKAEREKVFLGSRRGGGEYTVPEVKGYPGEELLKRGVVPDDVLNRKCLKRGKKRHRSDLSVIVQLQKDMAPLGRKEVDLKKKSLVANTARDPPIRIQTTRSHMCKPLSNSSFQ